jgi:hypothetical protein
MSYTGKEVEMYAQFERFEIKMTKNQALSASHSGACDDDIAYLLTLPAIKKQLAKIADNTLAEELKEYGAWEDFSNRDDNNARIIWLAACNIREEVH